MICRFSASIDGEMLETTASSALDRGFMSGVFSITGRGQQCVELVDDVMVTLSAGRGQQCWELVDDVIVTFSVGTL